MFWRLMFSQSTKRKTWKLFGNNNGGSWGGIGKLYKRHYHKTMRQQARNEIDYETGKADRVRMRGFIGASCEANYKGW